MNTAIVSGANGFVGSAVVKYLASQNVKVIALCRKGRDNNVPNTPLVKKFNIELGSIKDIVNKLPQRKYDIFYHFAWDGSAGEARADTRLQLQNAQWTVEALQAAHGLGCKRFICAGSIMEHETMAACYTQGNRPGLGYIYGGGKVIAHIMCMSVAAKLGIDLIWPEITNAYGVGEISPRMVNTTIRKCINKETPQFTAGTQNYDFVYIDDVARAFYLIGKNGKPFHEYLIGSSTARPLKEFLLEMKKSIAPDLVFMFGDIPFTGTNLPIEKFDCTNTEKDTGFKAQISFAEGTRRTMEWIKKVGK
ncbi:NAD-dependent epimerase/dehydratase family protein [Pectinatus frisingensis]|uniref:NAD-dependent epimerase/dehydratase family protein n=1 Tax=Pectinatus frisingensis TaxID=865 RepID=UPI0018C5125C